MVTIVRINDRLRCLDWAKVAHAGLAAGRTDPLVRDYPELMGSLYRPDQVRTLYAAFDDSRMVGTLLMEFPLAQRQWGVRWEIAVPPAHRRRGIATALYEHCLPIAVEHGRRTQRCEVHVPDGAAESPGSDFARELGFARRGTEDEYRLDLPVSPEHLDPPADGYDVVSWTDRCPDEYLDGYLRMRDRMDRDTPTGRLDHEPRVWTADRQRDSEDRLARSHRCLVSAARGPGGDFVGYSMMFAPVDRRSDEVWQDNTVVLTSHRGHRLGAALKARNLRTLAREFGDRRFVRAWTTGRAEGLRRLNTEFGYRRVETTHRFERRP